MGLYRRSSRGRNALYFIGWLLVVGVGIWLVWYGFAFNGKRERPEETPPADAVPVVPEVTSEPTISPLPPGVASVISTPTVPPLPTATPLPTPVPATPTSVAPYIVAGADGVNVRTGPGTNYTRLGYLDPDTQAELTGRYSDWWQIRYGDASGWIFGQLVTPFNADSVPQVEPPPAPTAPPSPPTANPTEPPPTEAPADTRGLLGYSFAVHNAGGSVQAPGPFAVNEAIWCDWHIQNSSGDQLDYTILGPWVEEANYHKPSWTNWHLDPGETLKTNDHLEIGAPGTYHLWMRVCFTDGACANVMGPVTVTVQ